MQQKLICGKVHVLRKCDGCQCMVWTKPSRAKGYLCDTCSHGALVDERRLGFDTKSTADYKYHGDHYRG